MTFVVLSGRITVVVECNTTASYALSPLGMIELM